MSSPDLLERAWAAGFFDAEGSFSYAHAGRGRRRAQVSVSQGGDRYPDTLDRFCNAVGGMGCKLRVPARGYLFYWYSHRHDVVRAVGMLLWPWLGADKRDEFESVMRLADGHWLEPLAPVAVSSMEELAWAAGLFDGEGSVTTSRSARSRTIEACLPQSAAAGIPNVLERFQRAVARGRIYGPRKRSDPWSKLPQYRWRSTNITDVCTTIEMLWPWLCEAKRNQTVNALERYGPRRARQSRSADRVAQQ